MDNGGNYGGLPSGGGGGGGGGGNGKFFTCNAALFYLDLWYFRLHLCVAAFGR
jgi:hypothetical protein